MAFAPNSRSGIQLVELTIAMSIGGILLAGLSSAVLLSGRAAALATTREASKDLSDAGLSRLRRDIELASAIEEAGADSVRLRMLTPDGGRAIHHYTWDGAGTPLRLAIDDGVEVAITAGLDEFNVGWSESKPTGYFQDFVPDGHFSYVAHNFGQTTFIANSASLNIPETYVPGDLLIAVVTIAANDSSSLVANSGWTQCLRVNESTSVTLGIYYSEGTPTAFTPSWRSLTNAALCVTHFVKPTDAPVKVAETESTTNANYLICPSVRAYGGSGLVIRAMGTEIAAVPYLPDFAGMPEFNVIACRTGLLHPGLGVVFGNHEGTVHETEFSLVPKAHNATATIVFQQ